MSKLTLGQKADRVLKFLLGMRNARIVSTLATRGFGTDDIEEGWQLLRNVARGKFDIPSVSPADPTIILEIDRWENTWFPVIEATLRRRCPAVADRVFLNLSQTEGAGVILSVGKLIERLDLLAKATDTESKAAMAVLIRRGVTEQVIEQARALLDTVGHTEASDPLDLDGQREELERAERELWDWYLEWSQIARSTLSDRKLLRALGFLTSTRSSSGTDDPDDDEPPTAGLVNGPGATALPLAAAVSAKAS